MTPCGTCDSGEWTCVGIELVSCRGELGEDARNDCGGCEELEAPLFEACGPCDDGLVACNGINATLCSGFTPDSDDDSVCDPFDVCPGGDDTVDTDGDGEPDFCDECPVDGADDSDGDGVCDSADICPGSDDGDDADGDGVPDGCDACSAGDDGADADGDGTPNACDCGSLVCDSNAFCSELETGAFCTCNAGFAGDGLSCDDVDECAGGLDTCSEFATCTDTEGSFDCECIDGFSGDGFTCSDVDECATDTADCAGNASCTNTLGGFTCECDPGYSGDGRTCSDVDECAAGTDTCSEFATCANADGAFTCACVATVSFPSGSFSRSISSYPWMWQAGDYYEESFTIGLASASSLDVSWVISNNSLSCDSHDIDVYVNGARVAMMVVPPGRTTHTQTLWFAPISGPTFTVRYSANNTVASGCGSMSLNESASQITFRP